MARGAQVAAFTMADDLGSALERADFADARDNLSVPFYAELEVLVRVNPTGINGELRHGLFPRMNVEAVGPRSDLHLPCELLEGDDHEFGRL
jgi:hypothetical protein